ncbi:MAG TPA: divalent-cation tolerance protein CutA [Saprospiraceae bacterium]|nr:divalent-cation tolerance protein CutA [Saprospiraceae bacterium]HMX88137.1 divalent-cation tolerance protein CutA [Saprospiraceae bacterium]HMZ38896.1 divalent-cation tolerance protein CutA [Saprospiraceae bacterium]HNA64946.1 divalent-cation tolerance protein CutA [Saprospiraceae bacterium]HNB30505.1 divalent-cation tolerance protein CutA [Saprospiraceae bacterium]
MKASKKIKVCYVPCSNTEEAGKIGRIVLEKKLAACMNIISADSLYWWEDRIQHEKEQILIIKTLRGYRKKMESCIRQNHSYSCPLILTINAEVNKDYYIWMKSVMRK